MTKRQDEQDAQEQQRKESQKRTEERKADAEEARANLGYGRTQKETDEVLARQREEEAKYRTAMAAKASEGTDPKRDPAGPIPPETPKPPPAFSVAARPAADLVRDDGTPLGNIPAPWIYTLIGIDGTVRGAVMADADAEWLDLAGQHLRVERIQTPQATRGVPVIFLPVGASADLVDPKVTPPDVFGGMTGLAGMANDALMRNYHNRPDSGPKAKVARRVVHRDPNNPAHQQKATHAA